jgi:hypothetical protein
VCNQAAAQSTYVLVELLKLRVVFERRKRAGDGAASRRLRCGARGGRRAVHARTQPAKGSDGLERRRRC